MFCIVEFEDDNSVETVPAAWLRENGKQCLWPPVRQTNAVVKLAKENHVPTDSWSSYKSRILFTSGIYYSYCGTLCSDTIAVYFHSVLEM